MPSEILRTAAWTISIITVIAAGLTYDTEWGPGTFIAAVINTAYAAALELRHRVDDDT